MRKIRGVFKDTLNSSIYLFAFSIAMLPFFASLALFLFIVVSVFHIKAKKIDKDSLVFLVLFSFPFFLCLIGLFFTEFFSRGSELTLRTSPIFFVPLLLIVTRAIERINYTKFQSSFVIGVFVSCLSTIIYGLYRALAFSEINYLLYFDLAELMHLHPTYYSIYILTAMVLLSKLGLKTIYKFGAFTLFFITLLLLQSKIGLIIFMLFCLKEAVDRFRKKQFGIVALILVPLVAIIVTSSNFRETRLNELFKERNSIAIGNQQEDGISQRMWLWSTALEHIKEKPLTGFGLGSKATLYKWKVEKDVLMGKYPHATARAMKKLATWNLHNTYLQVTYEFGIIGLILFLCSIYGLIKMSISKAKVCFFFVYVAFLLVLFVEVALNRQMGIYFYSLILPLLFFEDKLAENYSKQ